MTSLVCALPLIASLFAACGPVKPLAVGYVEGEFVQLAPIEVAQIDSISVKRGEHVERGATIATLERSDAEQAVRQAEAQYGQAQAQLADLELGRRPEEIAVLEASLNSAEAEVEQAQLVYGRQSDLLQRGFSAQSQYDQAKTNLDQARAQVRQAKANLAVAKLPARPDAIKAAENQVGMAKATLEQARWRLSQRTLTAPSPGRIDDIIRNPGDMAGPSAPVVSMLPDGAIKLKLYLPETLLSSVSVGSVLDVHCDGCPGGQTARVSYISPDPEFTPPVIYSLDRRQKLVYLVEARPDGDARALKPGQIVDVAISGDAGPESAGGKGE
jgi:HlyD family secretion protein